jgi:hypothetical protein
LLKKRLNKTYLGINDFFRQGRTRLWRGFSSALRQISTNILAQFTAFGKTQKICKISLIFGKKSMRKILFFLAKK